MSDRWRKIASSALVHSILLAIPFLVGIFVLKGLTVALQVHQGTDETEHYAAILAFARQLPFVDLHRSYGTSSGPLMYYVYGAFTQLFGSEIYKLRLLNTLVSYVTVLSVYFMLLRTLRTRAVVSLSLAAVVGFSPFLFGQTFVLLSDNFMYLWLVLALNALLRFSDKRALWSLVLASAYIALALLTRQFAIWLVPTAAFVAWRCAPSTGRKLGSLAIVAASCVPLGLVMLAWGGVVQPSSSGMATAQASRYWELAQTLSTVGLFVIMMVPLDRLRTMALDVTRGPLLIATGIASLVGLAADFIPNMPLQFGYLSLVAASYPDVLGSSIVYWILTPIGAMFLVWSLINHRADLPTQIASIALVFVTLTSLASNTYFQRYVDVPILLVMAVLISGSERLHRLDFVRWWILTAAFVGWIFAFVGMGRPVPDAPNVTNGP